MTQIEKFQIGRCKDIYNKLWRPSHSPATYW